MSTQNISGLTIHNASTGQSMVSDCPGNLRFHNPSGGAHLYGVDAGLGTGCTDTSLRNYLALANASHGPGAIDLTVLADPIFLQDGLVFVPGTQLDGRQAPIGRLWQNVQLTNVENPAGTGVQTGTADPTADCITKNLIAPPSANYRMQATLHCLDATNHMQMGVGLHGLQSPFHGYSVQYLQNAHELRLLRWDNSNITLDHISFFLDSGHNTSVTVALQWIAGSITWFVNGTPQSIVIDNTYPAAGYPFITTHANAAAFPSGSFMTGITGTAM